MYQLSLWKDGGHEGSVCGICVCMCVVFVSVWCVWCSVCECVLLTYHMHAACMYKYTGLAGDMEHHLSLFAIIFHDSVSYYSDL